MHSSLWLGTQTAYDATTAAKAGVMAKFGDRTEAPMPNLLSKQEGVGIIRISGSLVDGSAGFMSFFGVTGYNDIREAAIAAIKDPEIFSILLDINSGGGEVSGVHETAQLLQRIDKVKPIVSYTGGVEASAALWLGSSARQSFTSETAITGSLGVMTVHADKSQQLANEGVKVTIVRAGSEKALANPYEPLSDKAKENLQNRANAIYDVFLGHVASSRGITNTAADSKFGQGREFVGKQAVEAGLFDAVGTIEDAFAKAKDLGSKVAKKRSPATNGALAHTDTQVIAETSTAMSAKIEDVLVVAGATSVDLSDNLANLEGNPMPNPITQEQLIAMAAGVVLEQASTEVATVADTQTDPADTVADTQTAPTEQSGDLVAYLKEQAETAKADLLKLTAELELSKTALVTANASITALSEIVKASAKTMAVGLNEKTLADTLDGAALPAEHARLSALFKSKFKVGAVAATNTSDEGQPKSKATVDPLFAYAAKSLN